MTVCYPQIITARLCPRDELTFSATPPTCVRVVPVYNDATYVISQFPPPVHFLVRDNGQVYQLADIQSPPSTPPQYHAVLDATGCVLIGVELSAVAAVPITAAQINVLPGAIRHVLQTLGLPLTSVANALPPQRCRPQLWQQILAETQECLNSPPPPPPSPPALSCSFVLSCLQPGQNVSVSAGGIVSAGQLVPGPNPNEYTWIGPNGLPLYSFTTSSLALTVQDTPTVDMTLAGNTISAQVVLSPNAGNQIQALPNGLYVPPSAFSLNVQDTSTVDLDFTGGILIANVLISAAPGNQIQIVPDGLYVPPLPFLVQDTQTVDLTLLGNQLAADVLISAAPGNAVTVNPDGLFVSGTSNPCLSSAPALIAFPTANLLVSFNQNNNCLEQLSIPPEHVVYGNVNGSGAPQTGSLRYYPAPVNRLIGELNASGVSGVTNALVMTDASSVSPTAGYNILSAVSGASISGPLAHFAGVVRSSSLFGDISNFVGVIDSSTVNSVIRESLFSFNGVAVNGTVSAAVGALTSSNVFNITRSLAVANGYSVTNIVNSAIVAEGISGNTIENSVAISRSSNYQNVTGSFVNTNFTGLAPTTFSLAITNNTSVNNTQPLLLGSVYIAEQSQALPNNSPTVNYSIVTSRLSQYAQTGYDFSTIHADVSTFTGNNPVSHSFVSALQSTIGGAIRSVVLTTSLINQQTPSVYRSVLINDSFDTDPQRIGPPAPIIDTAFVASYSRVLANVFAAVYVNQGLNLFSDVANSVIVSSNIQTADPAPPSNVVSVADSLLVGANLDISTLLNVSSLTLVGSSLSAGANTVFGVGYGAYTTPAIQTAGGWLAYIANGGASDSQNYFQGWATNWRFTPFNPAVSYPNNAAAIGALNAAYSTDPRIALATMTVAIVNGTPAIFAWNGTTFVRISV